MSRKFREKPQFSTRHVVALAFAAYRANGNQYIKTGSVLDEETGNVVAAVTNREWIFNSLAGQAENGLQVLDEDFQSADAAKQDLQQAHMLQLLKSGTSNDFMQKISDILDDENCTASEVGLLAFVPKAHENQKSKQTIDEQLLEYTVTSQWLGREGGKVAIDFVLLSERYIADFEAWSMFGHDGQGNLVQFLTKHKHLGATGRIQGKIKKTERSRYHHNAQVTNINYVKRI